MRNSHFLLKVLNSYSLARCNQLCLTKFPKSPITRICSKIPSPCSVNKIPIIPHYLHLLQNFISFLNFLSPSSLKFYFPATRDLFISLLSFSHPHLLLSFLKEIFSFFLLLGLQFPQVLLPLSLLFSIVFCYQRSICMGTSSFSPSVVALSSQIFFSCPQICNFYRYCPLFLLFITILDLPYLIFVVVRFYDIEIGNNDLDQLANLVTRHIIDIYINKRFLFNCAFSHYIQEYILTCLIYSKM